MANDYLAKIRLVREIELTVWLEQDDDADARAVLMRNWRRGRLDGAIDGRFISDKARGMDDIGENLEIVPCSVNEGASADVVIETEAM